VQRPDISWKSRALWKGDGTSSAAKTHLFLCSDLGNYISGETIVADGGFSRWNGT
jgi:enoyl-[acyl-carrier-protein] reductase (NADH)